MSNLEYPKTSLAAVALIVIAGVCFLVQGCGYGEVSSETYELSTALYSICNRKAESQLAPFEAMVDDALEREAISDREADWLRDIVTMAREEEWSDAASEVRQILMDQVVEN